MILKYEVRYIIQKQHRHFDGAVQKAGISMDDIVPHKSDVDWSEDASKDYWEASDENRRQMIIMWGYDDERSTEAIRLFPKLCQPHDDNCDPQSLDVTEPHLPDNPSPHNGKLLVSITGLIGVLNDAPGAFRTLSAIGRFILNLFRHFQ